MTLREFGLLLLSIVAGVTGQFFLKTGALKLGKVNAGNVINHILGILTIPELIGGLLFYAMGAIVYILLLTRVNLSVVGPAVALQYVFSLLIGHFVFHEVIPVERALGLGFITLGVVLVVWQKA